jgi:hypothetical protein
MLYTQGENRYLGRRKDRIVVATAGKSFRDFMVLMLA